MRGFAAAAAAAWKNLTPTLAWSLAASPSGAGQRQGCLTWGVFVVVVVAADKDCGGNRRERRRHARNLTPSIVVSADW
ncbi:MAG: hypothetical protein J0L63_15860 [Anaerolineae bacterium]|nr:hypothetical protein [Anaerolineae bacterium]